MSKQNEFSDENEPAHYVAAAADPTAFQCSICMELIYKPCVNSCGHSFCFWCMHRAMDVFRTSHACPLCRAPFRHFPAVCVPLHSYLAHAFPDEMKGREEETRRMEREEYGADSPDVVVRRLKDGAFDVREAFECVDCGGLAVPPTVLTCGHVVCCGSSSSSSSPPSDGTATRRKRRRCPVDGCVGRTAAEGTGGGGPPSSVCAFADKILRDHVPEGEYREAASTSARLCGGLRSDDSAPPASAAGAAAGGETSTSSSSFGPHENVILTGLDSARGRRLNGTTGVIESRCERTDRYTVRVDRAPKDMPRQVRVKTQNMMRYVHYGVGCDGCGVYPIAGRRFKCEDCSEEIGFDLCGECHDVGLHERAAGDGNSSAGRFNQQHQPHHSMKEMERDQESALLQWLESNNHDLSLSQITQMMNMQVDS